VAEWKQVGNKLAYIFGELRGWTPSADVISAVMGGVYNCQNVRFEDGKIKTRGGWAQFTTGDSSITGIHAHSDSSGGNLISTEDRYLREYSTSGSAWVDKFTLIGGNRFSTTDFAVIPTSDGTSSVIVTDGDNYTYRWDINDVPFELGCTKIASMDENWTGSNVSVESTIKNSGTQSIKLTATDAGTTTAAYNVEGADTWSKAAPDLSGSAVRLGDVSGSERQVATRIAVDGTFDTVEFYYDPVNTPTGTNLFVRLETESNQHTPGDSKPSGTLIHANGYGIITPIQTGNKNKATVSLQGDITYTGSVWVVLGISADSAPTFSWEAQTTNDYYNILFDYSATGGENCYRDDASDPTGQTWSYYVTTRNIYVKIYNQGTGSLALGGADLANNGDDEVWIDVYADDASLVDDVTTVLRFTDSASATAYSAINIQTETDATWVTVKLVKDGFTESVGTFDWTDITKVEVELEVEGDSGTVNFYVDRIRFVATRVDSTEPNGGNTRPPKASYCTASPAGDRVILANTEAGITNSGPNFIWYSDSYNIDSFTSTQYFSFPMAITGLGTASGLVHVFTRDGRWVMEPNYQRGDVTSSAIDWNIRKADGPGCVSNRSISEGHYNDTSGLFFLAMDGVWFTNGIQAIKVSGDIKSLFEEKYSSSDLFYNDTFDKQFWQDAAGFYFDGYYYLAYQPSAQQDGTAAADNEEILILDTNTGTWMKDVPSGSVYPRQFTAWTNASGVPLLYCYGANDEVYVLTTSRATATDDGNAYQSDFQTCFIGTEMLQEVDWETLNIWVRSKTTSATSLIVKIFTIEDYDDTASYDEWEEDPDTAIATITTAWTPNTAFKWHRLRIKLDDNTNNVYPRSRAISLQIYDDNDTALDYYLESLICTPLHDELR